VADAPFMIEKSFVSTIERCGSQGRNQQTKVLAVPVPKVGSNEPFWEGQTWRRKGASLGSADCLLTWAERGEEAKERREGTGQLWGVTGEDEGEKAKERVNDDIQRRRPRHGNGRDWLKSATARD
jgi:hypothetical protein